MAVNPVNALVKLPTPVPSVVLESAVVGLVVELQHTPRAVTVDPPSAITVPPAVAVVDEILETDNVVTSNGI